MAQPIAVATEPAAEAAEQIEDHKDDQDQPKGHATLPARPATRHESAAPIDAAKHIPAGPATREGKAVGKYTAANYCASSLLERVVPPLRMGLVPCKGCTHRYQLKTTPFNIAADNQILSTCAVCSLENIRLSLLTARMAKPNPAGLVWCKKATFFT